MIAPDKVEKESERVKNKNVRFRSYLKNHADEDKLDAQFLKLHNELFSKYDCSKCRNCCTKYAVSFDSGESEIVEAANKLNLAVEDFKNKYLELSYGEYNATERPCNFLNEDMECILDDKKPKSCKNFPYTNQPGRLYRLIGVVDFASVCPVVFEILERLKKMYNFR